MNASLLCKRETKILATRGRFLLRRLVPHPPQHTYCFSSQRLVAPSILFSSNHLLVVNKPAGWHSIPLEDNKNSKKCLLSWLKRHSLGGGSRDDFLLPLHRLDQPCTGILLLAKTSKAASRITKVWKKHKVKKEYTCVLSSTSHFEALKRASRQIDGKWFELKAATMKHFRKSGSVTMVPIPLLGEEVSSLERPFDSAVMHSNPGARLVSIRWTMEVIMGRNPIIIVHTNEGSRHMVRSMLGQVGNAPICGDIRYGAVHPFPDRSVALHASRVTLPDSLLLPLDKKEFEAPLPIHWKTWFR